MTEAHHETAYLYRADYTNFVRVCSICEKPVVIDQLYIYYWDDLHKMIQYRANRYHVECIYDLYMVCDEHFVNGTGDDRRICLIRKPTMMKSANK